MLTSALRRDVPPLVGAAAGSAILAVAIGSRPALGVAVAGAVAIAVLVFAFATRPHWVAPIVLAGFVLQPTLKTFVSPYFGPAKDVIVVAALLAALTNRTLHRTRPRPGCEPDALLVGSVLLLLALYLVNPAGSHDSSWSQGTRLVVESFGLFLLGYTTQYPERPWRWACGSLIVVGLANALLGTVQQGIGTTRLILDYGYTWGGQVRETATGQFRSFGTLDDPFNYAAFMLLALAIAAFVVRRRALAIPICGVLLLGLGESFVRTAVFIVAVLAAVLLLRARRGLSAVAVAVALVVGAGGYLLLTPQGSANGSTSHGLAFFTTLNGRTATWSKVIRGPIDLIGGRGAGELGSGAARAQFGTIVPAAQPSRFPAENSAPATTITSIDSSYFATTADVGLAGLAVLLVIGLRAMTLTARAARAGSRTAWVAIAIGCILIIDATTRSSLTSFPFGFVGLYALGLALAQSRVEQFALVRAASRCATAEAA